MLLPMLALYGVLICTSLVSYVDTCHVLACVSHAHATVTNTQLLGRTDTHLGPLGGVEFLQLAVVDMMGIPAVGALWQAHSHPLSTPRHRWV